MTNTAEYMLDSCELPDKSVLEIVSRHDAAETLNVPGKWPRSFSTTVIVCPKCGYDLSQLSKKKQRQKSDSQLLVTKMHVIVIDILTRKCKRCWCYIVIRPDTLRLGLLNIGDLALVSIDVFFSLRNMIRFAFYCRLFSGCDTFGSF